MFPFCNKSIEKPISKFFLIHSFKLLKAKADPSSLIATISIVALYNQFKSDRKMNLNSRIHFNDMIFHKFAD
jgi:hypothetical protein